ncbi:hypothetical protein ABG768_007881, partial [Culter alburnus]
GGGRNSHRDGRRNEKKRGNEKERSRGRGVVKEQLTRSLGSGWMFPIMQLNHPPNDSFHRHLGNYRSQLLTPGRKRGGTDRVQRKWKKQEEREKGKSLNE